LSEILTVRPTYLTVEYLPDSPTNFSVCRTEHLIDLLILQLVKYMLIYYSL